MWTFFTFSMIGICTAIVFLIRQYADTKVEWVVRAATAYAWLTSMCIVALVPLDVWSTLAGRTSGRPAVNGLWAFCYWSTQLATWIVLPFYQVYSEAGDFSIKERAWTSIKENVILYGSLGALGIIGVSVVLIMEHGTMAEKLDSLLSLGVGLSNAFGLIAGLLLMGYGLVEIPRQVWKGSNPDMLLKWAAHRTGRYAETVMRARVELQDVVTIIYANMRQMRRTDPLRKYMDIIADTAEHESPVRPSEMASRTVDVDHLRAEELEYNAEKSGLAQLRRRLFWAMADYKGAHTRYGDVVEEALYLEGLVKARALHQYTGPAGLPGRKAGPWDAFVWQWDLHVRPYANRIFAVVLVCTSACIVWGEITIPVPQPDMSPFSLLIRSVTSKEEFPLQLFTLLPLVYICACMYFTLFRINAFNYNKLIERATTGAALMQNGSLMCRFAAPTCWNFLHILHMSQEFCKKGKTCPKTVFESGIMASLNLLPGSGKLNVYLPVILGVHVVITALNLWDKLFNCCTQTRFRFSSDDVDDEYTEKGRLLVRKEADAMGNGYNMGDILATAYVDLQFPVVKGMDRAFPGAVAQTQSKGLFAGLFGSRKVLEPVVAPTVAPTVQVAGSGDSMTGQGGSGAGAAAPQPKLYTSAAAQAASRWLQGGSAKGAQGGSTSNLMGTGAAPLAANSTGGRGGSGYSLARQSHGALADTGPKASLLHSRYDNSSGPATPSPGASTTDERAGAGASGLDGIFAGLLSGGKSSARV